MCTMWSCLLTGTTSGKKFISREQEPEQYWSSKGEAEGGNPMKASASTASRSQPQDDKATRVTSCAIARLAAL